MSQDIKEKIRERIAKAHEEAAAIGATLSLSEDTFIDDNHLDSTWYNGQIGSIHLANGWAVSIEVAGVVRLRGKNADGEAVDYENDGRDDVEDTEMFRQIPDDETLNKLLNDGMITFWNNNWIEFFLIDPDGEEADTDWFDTIIEGDVLDGFSDFDHYVSVIKEYENGNFDDEDEDFE